MSPRSKLRIAAEDRFTHRLEIEAESEAWPFPGVDPKELMRRPEFRAAFDDQFDMVVLSVARHYTKKFAEIFGQVTSHMVFPPDSG